MKNQMTVIAITGLLSIFSSTAIAGATASEQDLNKLIQENASKKQATEAAKYKQVLAVAGDKRDELAAKNNEVVNAYDKWRELKSAAETAPSDSAKLKAVEAGAKYAQANKEFIDMQKNILVKMSSNISVAQEINALNATAPAAAGR